VFFKSADDVVPVPRLLLDQIQDDVLKVPSPKQTAMPWTGEKPVHVKHLHLQENIVFITPCIGR